MFRCRQQLNYAHCCPVYTQEQRTLESGEIVNELVSLGDKKLPDPELFDLKNQLKAGIQMDEVNPNILSTRSVDVSKVVRRYSKVKRASVENSETSEEV